MPHRKKKTERRSRPPKAPSNAATNETQRQQQLCRRELRQQEDERNVRLFTERFRFCLKEADGDPIKAIKILSSRLDGDTKSEGPDRSTRESSSTSSLDFSQTGGVQNVRTGRGKQPSRVVATRGSVSRWLGKEYARASTHGSRNYSKVLTGSKAISPTSSTSNESAQGVLDIPKSAAHGPSTMNWINAVKKGQSRRPRFDASTSTVAERQQDNCAKGDEDHVFRNKDNEQWKLVGSYSQKAKVANSEGERGYPAHRSNQGKKLDEKTSQEIFKAKNQCFENRVTFDLHGQDWKQARKIVKRHLLYATRMASIQTLKVITGSGLHSEGKAVLKPRVIDLLKKEHIKWYKDAENPGALLIKLDGRRKFSFQGTDSDSR